MGNSEFEFEKISTCTVEEYFYPSREARDKHVEYMKSLNWECSGQSKWVFNLNNDNWKWYAKFTKFNV